jgi:hypothetical protein
LMTTASLLVSITIFSVNCVLIGRSWIAMSSLLLLFQEHALKTDNKKNRGTGFSFASAHDQGCLFSFCLFHSKIGGLPLEMGTLMPMLSKIGASVRTSESQITHFGAQDLA